MRLIESVWAHLGSHPEGGWRWERSLVVRDRDEVAVFHRPGGREVAIYFDQVVLPPGPRDFGVQKYLGHGGRLRPDITIVRRVAGRVIAACPIEVKCSSDPSYLAQGFEEAHLYAREYRPLTEVGWPAGILVIPGDCRAAPSEEDRVVAVGWRDWVPEGILAALVG